MTFFIGITSTEKRTEKKDSLAIRKEFMINRTISCLILPNLGIITINAIYASDYFLIPLTADKGALDGMADYV